MHWGFAVFRFAVLICIALLVPAMADPKSDALLAPTIVRAKAALLRTLPTPEVVEFRNVVAKITKNRRGDYVNVVCGEVNTYGNRGFVGFEPFAYVAEPAQLIMVLEQSPSETKDLMHFLCN
jgi:hypothetical protein